MALLSRWALYTDGYGMLRGPLYQEGYRPQLSGHETFPLRYGWLKKAFDAVHETEDGKGDNRGVFLGDDAIARLGVGKNMVASMRHWASAAGVIEDAPGADRLVTTQLGRTLFADDGLDPYMENPATSWLVHWRLCAHPQKTTWFWAFNYFPYTAFERETLTDGLAKLAKDRGWRRASASTLKNDVACFLRTYVAQLPGDQNGYEEALESPLTELGLIKRIGKRSGYRFMRGQKPSLEMGVFCYAVTQFWRRFFDSAQTLSFEALSHEPGSPGRVFLLDENDMVDLLSGVDEASGGVYQWSETAGLKQLIRTRRLNPDEDVDFLTADRAGTHQEKVA